MKFLLCLNFIKSYVCREYKYLLKIDFKFKKYWVYYVLQNINVNFFFLFPNTSSLILEIGFGYGDNLFFLSSCYKNFNFLGIEIYKSGIYYFFLKLKSFFLNNVKILYGNFYYLLKKSICIDSFKMIQIYYPDPWKKKKHYKRKLINKNFLFFVRMILKIDGFFFIVTDCIIYSKFIKYIFIKYYFCNIFFKCDFVFVGSKFNYKCLLSKKNVYFFLYYISK